MSEFDDIFTASSKEPEEVSVPPFDTSVVFCLQPFTR